MQVAPPAHSPAHGLNESPSEKEGKYRTPKPRVGKLNQPQ